jgi:DNA repair exonuclease SbcCD nuclease subunit
MKIAITADLHLKMWNDKEYDSDGIPRRLNEIIQVIKQICEYCKNNNIDTIIIAGDINDLKNIVHVPSFNILKEVMQQYHNLNFIVLHGNHDSSNKMQTNSAIQLLSGPTNISIITNPIKEGDITFLPYSHNIIEYIKECENNKILIGHFGLSDATLSSGISVKTRVQSGDLKKFDLVILGHYHKPQKINHVYYVGSPIQLRRDEHSEEKRFLVIDTETLNVQSIPTIGYRKYVQLEINEESQIETTISLAKKLQSEGNYVNIFSKVKNIYNILKEDINIIDNSDVERRDRGINTAMSIESQMEKWLDIDPVPESQKRKYLELGISILGENDDI